MHSSSIIEANNILKEIIGNKVETIFMEKRHEVEHAIPTYQKSIDLLNFNHKVDLKEGLTKMWNWS